MTDEKHIFISYCRDGATNQQWAERIHTRLNEYGFKVWRDVEGIQPGERWNEKIPPAIEQSAIVLCITSESLLASEWVDDELNFARQRKLLIIPIRIETEYRPPFMLSGVQKLDLYTDDQQAWDKLLELADRHLPRNQTGSLKIISRPAEPERQRELEYLDRLLYTGKQVAKLTPIYTKLASHIDHLQKNFSDVLTVNLIPAAFVHQPFESRETVQGQRYEDILDLFVSYRNRKPQLALLGEPGAGKSFSLQRVSAQLALDASQNPTAVIPLLAELGDWIDDDESFDDFLKKTIQPLSSDLRELVNSGRAYLLLDALNEIPTGQQRTKIEEIKCWLKDSRLAGLVISCRERDFTDSLKLDIDTVTIEPLDPVRIYLFIQRYLTAFKLQKAAEQGEQLFWQLAQGNTNQLEVAYAKDVWKKLQKKGVDNFQQFWSCDQAIPLTTPDNRALVEKINSLTKDSSSLLKLAEIPYLLIILVDLFRKGELPEQDKKRVNIFKRFVEVLLQRERERFQKATGDQTPPGEEGLLEALAAMAWNLQNAAHNKQQSSVQTSLMLSSDQLSLTDVQLNHALAANLLQLGAQQVKFIHQLLQEYFAALGLKIQIEQGTLPAETLWPRNAWWKPTGWEEVVNTVAALFADDITLFATWLAEANPKLLADSLAFNGLLNGKNERLREYTDGWPQRLIDPELEPDPAARNAIGSALASLKHDDRVGIGCNEKGIPDIDWVEIKGGEFLYKVIKQHKKIETFHIARYPITNEQYDAFIRAGGYKDERWWQGLAERIEQPKKPGWSQLNRPRDTVSWYEAIAFCRWLSAQLGYTVSPPTEPQWERAACGSDGREYPWGNDYQSGFANVNEKVIEADPHYLQQTSTVGMYAFAGSQEGVQDLSGNVWEWSLNKYDNPENTSIEGDGPRVLRGGSWRYLPHYARASSRFENYPDNRDDSVGFRVVCSSPISR